MDVTAALVAQIGIQPCEQVYFGHITSVALQTPLPPRWRSHVDATTGCVYYVDCDGTASSWENPLLPYIRRVVDIGRLYLQQPTPEFFAQQRDALWSHHKLGLDSWHGPLVHPSGHLYFTNSRSGCSTWQDPRVDAQYIFDLESKLLAGLEDLLPSPSPSTPTFLAGNAEVLVLDGSLLPNTPERADHVEQGRSPTQAPGTRKPKNSCINMRCRTSDGERRGALQRVQALLSKVDNLCRHDEEVQRLEILRKVSARRQRRSASRCNSPLDLKHTSVDSVLYSSRVDPELLVATDAQSRARDGVQMRDGSKPALLPQLPGLIAESAVAEALFEFQEDRPRHSVRCHSSPRPPETVAPCEPREEQDNSSDSHCFEDLSRACPPDRPSSSYECAPEVAPKLSGSVGSWLSRQFTKMAPPSACLVQSIDSETYDTQSEGALRSAAFVPIRRNAKSWTGASLEPIQFPPPHSSFAGVAA